MAIKREHIGESRSGEPIYAYRLSNRTGLGVTIWNLGAAIKSITVPTKNAGAVEVCASPLDIKSHMSSRHVAGAVLGPVFHPQGEDGIQKRVWEAKEGDGEITFFVELASGEYGYPGKRRVSVSYSLDAEGRLKEHINATTDEYTPFLITRRLCLNLRGRDAGSVEGDYVQIFAKNYLPVGSDLVPGTDMTSVAGTPFDFTVPREVGVKMASDCDQLAICKGYDHCFCLENGSGEVAEAAVCSSPATGITVCVSTDLPGLWFVAHMPKNQPGDNGMTSFCIGTQSLPSEDEGVFGRMPGYGPDEPFLATTIYRFA